MHGSHDEIKEGVSIIFKYLSLGHVRQVLKSQVKQFKNL